VLGLERPSPRTLKWAACRAGLTSWAGTLLLESAERPASSVRCSDPWLVYLVEDDDGVREALTHYLGGKGAEVVAYADELSLFAAVALRRPAAILLDVVLRRVDGLRLCEELKRHPLTREVRVLLTSGIDRPYLRSRAMAAGADAFLPKPFDPLILWGALGLPARLSPETAQPGGYLDAAAAPSSHRS
jgi:CheY-like chemotaxis protein